MELKYPLSTTYKKTFSLDPPCKRNLEHYWEDLCTVLDVLLRGPHANRLRLLRLQEERQQVPGYRPTSRPNTWRKPACNYLEPSCENLYARVAIQAFSST